MNPQEQRSNRTVGSFLAFAGVMFLLAVTWHGVVHPFAGATAEQSLPLVRERLSGWFAMHFFFSLAAVSLAASSLGVLTLRSNLTGSLSGLVGWSVLSVVAVLAAGLAITEATVQADAAAAGDLPTFEMWFSLSRGVELLFILLPLAFIAIVLGDLRNPTPSVPRWAGGVALAGAVLVIPAIVGASGFRIAALGPLWSAAAFPVVWLIWLGRRLAAKRRET